MFVIVFDYLFGVVLRIGLHSVAVPGLDFGKIVCLLFE